jgi:type IV secretion system protein VirB10
MRLFGLSVVGFLLALQAATAQSNQDFSGAWDLNSARSEIQSSVPGDPGLKVEQNAASLSWSAGAATPSIDPSIYPLDGRVEKRRAGDSDFSTTTKWEGAALLVNTIVSGPQNYTLMERWTRSRDGNTLTIRRTIVRLRNEMESTLVYNRAGAAAPEVLTTRTPIPAQPTPPAPTEFVVDQGTRILLRLTNSVNTKRTVPGDRVYLETAVPIFVDGRLLIPRGSYVTGTVTESKQAGRVKGKAALNLRFDTLTLPNGVTRDFRSRAGSADTRGNLDRSEGRIEGEGNKSGDAKTVGETTAAGAGIGTIAGAATGHYGLGAGIGAAAGAAAGLVGVLGSRGPEVVLPAGTTMELVLDRDLRFTSEDLRQAPR